jgi:hypothetical protein
MSIAAHKLLLLFSGSAGGSVTATVSALAITDFNSNLLQTIDGHQLEALA